MEEMKIYEEPNNFLIIGKKGSAKTALGMCFMKNNIELGKRKAYFYRYPQPELLKELPFESENIVSMKEMYNITNGVILIDEAHRHFNVLNKSVNEDLKELLANSRQNNCSFIFITHNSYFITRGLFTYIDVKIIKEVNEGHWDTERTHMKKLYSNTFVSGKNMFFIDSDYVRGKEYFDKPEWFTDAISTAYKNQQVEEKLGFFKRLRKTANKCEVVPKEIK